MTLKQLLDIEWENEREYYFCIFIKDINHDVITTTIEMTFRKLGDIVGLFLLIQEIEEWELQKNNAIYIRLKG